MKANLYGILDLGYVTPPNAARTLERMLEGGVDLVQLRAKKVPLPEIAALARELHPLAQAAKIPFILNDAPALAKELGLEGAHVGQDDLAISEARRIGPGLLGLSTHSVEQAVAAARPANPDDRPDYIGFGPLFATPTKPDYTPIGVDDIRRVHELVDLPIFCIGGIKLENVADVVAAGAQRVVIVSGILQADDIVGYCREVRALLPA